MKVIFMRGIPGSDKSGWASSRFGQDSKAIILSAADFFMVNGKYVWVGDKTPQSHAWNKQRFQKALEDGMETIIIDNTNIKYWEMKIYIDILKGWSNYSVFQKCMDIDPVDAFPISRHKVPLKALIRMSESFEIVPQMEHF